MAQRPVSWVNVTQGTLRNLRVQLFTHMESLPIRYFDSHSHGDIMSVYTNDVDTLRQMISRAFPSWCPAPSPSCPYSPVCA